MSLLYRELKERREQISSRLYEQRGGSLYPANLVNDQTKNVSVVDEVKSEITVPRNLAPVNTEKYKRIKTIPTVSKPQTDYFIPKLTRIATDEGIGMEILSGIAELIGMFV